MSVTRIVACTRTKMEEGGEVANKNAGASFRHLPARQLSACCQVWPAARFLLGCSNFVQVCCGAPDTASRAARPAVLLVLQPRTPEMLFSPAFAFPCMLSLHPSRLVRYYTKWHQRVQSPWPVQHARHEKETCIEPGPIP